MDGIDREILTIIQKNGRMSNADVARQVGMAPSAVLERIRKLESKGIIKGYCAQLSPRALGCGLLAFIFVRTRDEITSDTGKLLAKIPEVQEVHHVAGEDCYLVKVRTAGTDALGALLRERFAAIPSVVSTRTTIVLETLKENSRLPLPHPSEQA